MRTIKVGKKVFFIVLAGLLVIGTGLVALNRWADRQIVAAIRSALPGRAELGRTHWSLMGGYVRVDSVKILLDSSPPDHQGVILCKGFDLEGIRVWTLFRRRELLASRLTVEELTLRFDGQQARQADSLLRGSAGPGGPAWKAVGIGAVALPHIDLGLYDHNDLLLTASGSVVLQRVMLQRAASGPGFGFGRFTVQCDEALYRQKMYRYLLKGGRAEGDSITTRLTIDTLRSLPVFGKEAFGRVLRRQADRIESLFTGISIDALETAPLLAHRIQAGVLRIRQARASIYRDRRLPLQAYLQPLPAQLLHRLPAALRLRALRVDHVAITYEEQPKNGSGTGILRITQGSLRCSPVISHPLPSDPDSMLLRATGSLMAAGTITAVIGLPLHNDVYSVAGAIEGLQLPALNSASENLGHIHIQSGVLDSLGFRFSFNRLRSTGKIVGIYHQLIIQPLTGKPGSLKPAKLRSFVLRRLIIPLNKDRSLPERRRTGIIRYTRDPSRKLSFYLLQSLLSGIKSSFSLGFLLPQ